MKTFSQFMLAAILLVCGSTMFTSCTASDDNPTESSSAISAKQLVGEWILEIEAESIEPIDPEEDIKYPTDANGLTLIYHFNAEGYGWKEMNILKDGEPVFVPFDRYNCKFVYTVSAQGEVNVVFVDENDKPTDESDKLNFDGIKLWFEMNGVNNYLSRATDEQIKKYKELADEWHGGSDESIRVVTGISNIDWKWIDEISVLDYDR